MERILRYVLPEIRRLMEQTEIKTSPHPTDRFWDFDHPRIKSLAKPRFEAGFFGVAGKEPAKHNYVPET